MFSGTVTAISRLRSARQKYHRLNGLYSRKNGNTVKNGGSVIGVGNAYVIFGKRILRAGYLRRFTVGGGEYEVIRNAVRIGFYRVKHALAILKRGADGDKRSRNGEALRADKCLHSERSRLGICGKKFRVGKLCR